jgi:hypothetical protein
MMAKHFFVPLSFLFLCLIGLFFLSDCSAGDADEESAFQKDTVVLGTWWWYTENDDKQSLLEFAVKNTVNEIYFSTVDFSGATRDFISESRRRGINVYLLAGRYQYIEDRTGFVSLMDRFIEYQQNVGVEEQFSGLHLDVEPHQHPDFGVRRAELLGEYLDFVIWVCAQYKTNDALGAAMNHIDFDIPFWFDDELLYKGNSVKLFEAVIAEADRVCVMSYRDTAQQIFDTAKEELDCAKLNNKQILLSVETQPSDEGDFVSFYEEGKAAMYREIHNLKNICDDVDYGVAIHHLSSWYELKP